MTERIKRLYNFLKSGVYKSTRRALTERNVVFPEESGVMEINVQLFKYMIESEEPRLYEDDRFGFNRTIRNTPIGLCGDKKIGSGGGNVTINYARTLAYGMDDIKERIKAALLVCEDGQRAFLSAAMECVDIALGFADKYREYAKECGATELYEALCVVPHGGAKSFYQALVFMKFLQFTLRCNRNDHITLGGFDKYMLPYFDADLKRGVSEDELFELIEEFFITMNLDTDTYFGIQRGDNGMSMVLGGRDVHGNDRYNKLSEMCILASMELSIIDPKINLRVDKNTPTERLEFATRLTKKGLGFPQYCNDDIVIPGLIRLGYSPEDACDYTVAACWEFIPSANAYDYPNLEKVNFPLAVERAVNEHLRECECFEEFVDKIKGCVREECHVAAKRMINKRAIPSPYLSVFIDDCIGRGLDVSEGGAIYNNYGAHGVGIAPAADAIAAVKRAVFDEKICTSDELLCALNNNFEGYAELRGYLLSCPKMGNNDDEADKYATMLIDINVEVFSGYRNIHGGILRVGTGSAHEYMYSAQKVGATADGRYAYTPFGSSFSPSPTTRLRGPLSCIQSFTKYDLKKAVNGGPLTLEIHENTFRNDDGIKKVAALVRAFITLGGHQLQLNSINREVLIDAQKHPENHKNLIVRVWGWSGYFCELDVKFQDHIISRTEFTV